MTSKAKAQSAVPKKKELDAFSSAAWSDDSSTVCPSSTQISSKFFDTLSDPENASIANKCMEGIGHDDGDASMVKYYNASMSCSNAVLDGINSHKQAEKEVFDNYGDEADIHRQTSEAISEKLAIFALNVMHANTNVQKIVTNAKLGMKFLKKLKTESSKGHLADQPRMAVFAQKTVEHLEKGQMSDQIAQELQTVSNSADELTELADSAQKALSEFTEIKSRERDEMLVKAEQEYLAAKAERDSKVKEMEAQLEDLHKEKGLVDAEVCKAKEEVGKAKEDAAMLKKEHDELTSAASLADKSMKGSKRYAEFSFIFFCGIGVIGLMALGVAALCSGGAAASLLLVAWAAHHTALWAGAAAAASGLKTGWELKEYFRYLNLNKLKVAAAREKSKEMENASKALGIKQAGLEEKVAQAEALQTEELSKMKAQMLALHEEQIQKNAKAEADYAAIQAQADIMHRKFQVLHDLTTRYSTFVDELKKSKITPICKAMISTLEGFGVIRMEVGGLEQMADNEAELVQELASKSFLPYIDSTIQSLENLQTLNNDLLQRAQDVYNTYYGLTGEVKFYPPNTRMTDADEDGAVRGPLDGIFTKAKEVSLEEALAPISEVHRQSLLRTCRVKAQQLERKYPHMSADRRGVLVAYSAELEPSSDSPYWKCNGALRSQVRTDVRPWVSFIWLCLNALADLQPSDHTTLYRGYKKDIADLGENFQMGATLVLSGFTSVSWSLNAMQTFVGDSGDRTIVVFNVHRKPRSIAAFSLFPAEQEVVLPPNTMWKVEGHVSLGHGLTMVQANEIESNCDLMPYL